MELTLLGKIGRYLRSGNGDRVPLSLTQNQGLRIAQLEPDGMELARGGFDFVGGTQVIASGIAPVSAIPTTTATLALYNTDAAYSLFVDQVSFALGSGTAAAGATLYLALSNGPIAAANIPSAASNYSTQCLSTTGKATVARWGTAVTFPAGSAWFQATSTFQLAAANVGQGDAPAKFTRGILIPPGYALGFGILSGAGTSPLYSVSAKWAELALDIE